MNLHSQLSAEEVAELKHFFSQGFSNTRIAALTYHTRATVKRYREMYPGPPCPCGKPATHKGWCKFRFTLSPVRQRLMKRMRVLRNQL